MDAPLGPVMVDVHGLTLDKAEAEMLQHPLVGGVILFSRNFSSVTQLRELTSQIRALRKPDLLIAVDHEGGRVQRFRAGFTSIPAMRRLGEISESGGGASIAEAAGYVLASELLAHGIDFSFTPVLDLDFGASSVIGDRSFSSDPMQVAHLADALLSGMRSAGMAGVGKHFPGHGYVKADSHVAVPVDDRTLEQIRSIDIVPYQQLIPRGLEGVMPAHVIYPAVDSNPAGFSEVWLKNILRTELGFDGLIFSDDLSMEGASVAGDIVARGEAAFSAGCDMVLVCNAPERAAELLSGLRARSMSAIRANRMRGRALGRRTEGDTRYAEAIASLSRYLG